MIFKSFNPPLNRHYPTIISNQKSPANAPPPVSDAREKDNSVSKKYRPVGSPRDLDPFYILVQ